MVEKNVEVCIRGTGSKRGAAAREGPCLRCRSGADLLRLATDFSTRAWPTRPVFVCRNPGAIRSPDSGDGVHLMCLVSICFIQGGRNLGLVSCPESGLQNAPGSRHRKIKKISAVCAAILELWCHPSHRVPAPAQPKLRFVNVTVGAMCNQYHKLRERPDC